MKSMGSNKTGKSCPSRIEATYQTRSTVLVKYFNAHCGHSFHLGLVNFNESVEVQYCRYKNEKNVGLKNNIYCTFIIVAKLKEGVPLYRLLESVRYSVTNAQWSAPSTLLLEEKDLHNIIRDFNIGYSTKKHSNDAVIVKLWVEEMQ